MIFKDRTVDLMMDSMLIMERNRESMKRQPAETPLLPPPSVDTRVTVISVMQNRMVQITDMTTHLMPATGLRTDPQQ